MPDRLYTIPITCCLDGQAHHVTDENVATGSLTGEYQALCGHRVSGLADGRARRPAVRTV